MDTSHAPFAKDISDDVSAFGDRLKLGHAATPFGSEHCSAMGLQPEPPGWKLWAEAWCVQCPTTELRTSVKAIRMWYEQFIQNGAGDV